MNYHVLGVPLNKNTVVATHAKDALYEKPLEIEYQTLTKFVFLIRLYAYRLHAKVGYMHDKFLKF